MKDIAPTASRASPQPEDDKGEINLTDMLRTIWRGKLWVLLTALIGLGLGGYYAFAVATPIYTANAAVVLESRQEQVVNLESVVSGLSGDQATINTEVEVIRARGLLEKLVLNLDLMRDPEFNTALQVKNGPVASTLVWVKGMLGQGSAKEALDPRAQMDAVIDLLREAITVSNVRQSYVFRISAKSESAEKSAAIANTLATLYILEQIEVKFEATETATAWLSARVGDLQADLEAAVAAVKDFNADSDLISAEALAGLNRQLKEARDRLGSIQEAQVTANARLAELRAAQDAGDPEAMATLARDRVLTRIARNLNDTSHPAFDARFAQVLERAALDVSRAANQIAALTASVAAQEADIATQSADLVRLEQLEREAEATRLIYESFLNRLKETTLQQGIQQADSRVLSVAPLPLVPSEPRRILILALSLIFGTIAGVVFVLAREFSQNTFRLAEDLEAKTGYPVLGQIPAIPARKRKTVLQYLADKPTSAAAEAIRNLRTSVLLSDLDTPPQIIMSTSSVPGEGKTLQSLALAQNLAGLGKSVLLIEGDMRRRVFAEYFDTKGRKGILSVLSGAVPFEEAVMQTPLLGADILIAEAAKANAADTFSSEAFKTFLEAMRSAYDYIIIDTPPILAVHDARVIGQHVDTILYTVRWDSTSQRQVREGLRGLEAVNLRVSGLVLAQISPKGMARYGYGDSYGAYTAYYES
ncbi:polysaccharide biosynthesis tyrosine autokinase [Roseovarius sp. LXJ103]|uniref:GumC family protein n=1 Tax=Roseovarius carneus TaxID=2853164 RepID=UPI000D606CE6|nr:polysaccharide biosynthesis tyrosine autokinase [Roseovarius carneus]MBZ8117577.1 polysaccharide biosynthesis tyrosine autokinase [Roseovarius carneus]PWE36632.1 chain-length determining protein [Pelagicola sp. LXJ1103]